MITIPITDEGVFVRFVSPDNKFLDLKWESGMFKIVSNDAELDIVAPFSVTGNADVSGDLQVAGNINLIGQLNTP